MLRNVVLRGILFLIPIGILVFVFIQLFRVSIVVAEVVDGVVPIETVAGVGVANLLAILVIVLLCILAGFLSYISIVNDRVSRLDTILSNNVPGYVLVKGVLSAGESDPYEQDTLKPVLVEMGVFERIGFETDRGQGKVVVFLPNQPSVVTGHSIVVDETRVRALDLPPRQVLSLLQVHGKGLAPLLPADVVSG